MATIIGPINGTASTVIVALAGGCCVRYPVAAGIRSALAESGKPMITAEAGRPADFIREIVADDTRTGKWEGRVVTRFPPEPNGYLHIGHAKSICLNFGIASEFGGECHLRFDDTNPIVEEVKFVEAIQKSIRWLGWDWGETVYYASDYFDQLYQWAVQLIQNGKAYVDDQSPDQVRQRRGTLTDPGQESPFRDRSVEENINLFERMRASEFDEGTRVLRAKIDMTSPNLNMRDPVMYRILKQPHHRTGDKWSIYPTYDFAHGQSDSIEGVTHSLCDKSFEDHRPLYDWYLDALGIYHPQQIEFARLNLSHTILSKRRLRELVECGDVSGWDDPRMPTLAGLGRRGYTPEAIRDFCGRIGIAKRENVVEIALLEHCLREDLNRRAPRVMAVLNPLKVVIENYPEDRVEQLVAINNPEDDAAGTRPVSFSREIYIERDDFLEEPPRKFFRLALGREVRLRYAYFITCKRVIKDDAGQVVELRCTYDPATRGGNAPDGRKVKGTLHWVSATASLEAEIRMYGHLFSRENPDEGDFRSNLNPNSRVILPHCKVEPALANATVGSWYQFERQGYFCLDPDTSPRGLVFSRAVALRDSWSKIAKQKA